MDRQDLKNEFRSIVADSNAGTEYEVTARNCTSDAFSGVEFRINGGYIPIDEVLEVIRDRDTLFIENIGVAPEGEGSCLTLFVVDVNLDPSGHATLAEMEHYD